ncbi:hypothetical protein OIY81_3068, partial [Cryptosporidium canis]
QGLAGLQDAKALINKSTPRPRAALCLDWRAPQHSELAIAE